MTTTTGLSDRAKAILDLERSWFQYAGIKEQRVRETFEVSMTGYYQELNAVLDDPAALAHDPLGVKRLRRLREQRKRGRGVTNATRVRNREILRTNP